MKQAAIFLVLEAASITSVVSAAALALHDKPGWGWFLAAAIALGAYSANVKP